MSKHPPGFMVYSTPHNFVLFWQNKDRSKTFKSSPSSHEQSVWQQNFMPMLTYTPVHCFNILHSRSRVVRWLMGYSLLRWCTVINADACKRVREKETDRERDRGGAVMCCLCKCPSLSSPSRALILSSLPVFLLRWSSLYICICCTLPNTGAFSQMAECFLPEHMQHQATFRRLPDHSLSEIYQKCERLCVCVWLLQSSSQIWGGHWHVSRNLWPGFSCCLNVV